MVYININQKEIDKVAKKGITQAKEDSGDDYTEGEMTFSDSYTGAGEIVAHIDEIYLEDGEIHLSVDLKVKGHDLVYLSFEIPVDIELAIDITQHYMKKLGKLKTILEATKGV